MSSSIGTSAISVASGKPFGRIQDLPDACFTRFVGFLNPLEIVLLEQVNRFWHNQIRTGHRHIWKPQCAIQGIAAVDVHPPVESALGTSSSVRFNDVIIALIADYANEIFKDLALPLRGNLYLGAFRHPQMYIKGHGKALQLRWGKSHLGPFLFNVISNKESIAACKRAHLSNKDTFELNGSHGTWAEGLLPRIPQFPSYLPLRFFINPNGQYKQAGDKIKLCYQRRFIVLTCTYRSEEVDGHPIPDFAAGVARRVQSSVACRFITLADVECAKNAATTAAATMQGDWISSD